MVFTQMVLLLEPCKLAPMEELPIILQNTGCHDQRQVIQLLNYANLQNRDRNPLTLL